MSEDILNQVNFINDWYYDMAKRALRKFKPTEAAAKAMLEELQFLGEDMQNGFCWTYEGVLEALKELE